MMELAPMMPYVIYRQKYILNCSKSPQIFRGKPLMEKNRLEAFSDGVIAIIITIMVLEMKVPHGDELAALHALIPQFISYVLSFIYVGIYWNNHHHLLHTIQKVNGSILWANLYLLFWLSLLPFVTGWMGENHFSTWPMAFYGIVLLMTGIAYRILELVLIRYHGKDSRLAKAVGHDFKSKISLVIYASAIPFSFASGWFAFSLYVLVALIWVIPDSRIEKS
jgi:uncharacterized membrane protein